MPAAQRFLEIVQGTGDFVRKRIALLTENDMFVVCPCKINASAEALPQEQGRNMYW